MTESFAMRHTNPFCEKEEWLICMCINDGELNKVTIKNKYLLPQIDDLFDQLKSALVFQRLI